MTIIVTNIESFKALVPFQSREETRYYLNGVYFDPKGLLVATDSQRLGCVKPALYECNGETGFILPSATVNALVKVKPITKRLALLVQIDTENKTVSAIHRGEETVVIVSFPFAPIDGTFPDWRRVIPQAESFTTPASSAFSTSSLAAFESFGKVIDIYPNNEPGSPMILRARNDNFDAVGVLMPMRSGLESHPAWL